MKISTTTPLPVPAAEAYELVADFGSDHRWRDPVVEMTPSPPGLAAVGTSVHEVVRFAGSTYVTDTTVTEVVPGRLVAFEGGGADTRVRGMRAVEPTADGTCRFTLELDIRLAGPKRVLEPLLGLLYRRQMRADGEALRTLLAERPVAAPAPSGRR